MHNIHILTATTTPSRNLNQVVADELYGAPVETAAKASVDGKCEDPMAMFSVMDLSVVDWTNPVIAPYISYVGLRRMYLWLDENKTRLSQNLHLEGSDQVQNVITKFVRVVKKSFAFHGVRPREDGSDPKLFECLLWNANDNADDTDGAFEIECPPPSINSPPPSSSPNTPNTNYLLLPQVGVQSHQIGAVLRYDSTASGSEFRLYDCTLNALQTNGGTPKCVYWDMKRERVSTGLKDFVQTFSSDDHDRITIKSTDDYYSAVLLLVDPTANMVGTGAKDKLMKTKKDVEGSEMLFSRNVDHQTINSALLFLLASDAFDPNEGNINNIQTQIVTLVNECSVAMKMQSFTYLREKAYLDDLEGFLNEPVATSKTKLNPTRVPVVTALQCTNDNDLSWTDLQPVPSYTAGDFLSRMLERFKKQNSGSSEAEFHRRLTIAKSEYGECVPPTDDTLTLYTGTGNLRVFPEFSGIVTDVEGLVSCAEHFAESDGSSIQATCVRTILRDKVPYHYEMIISGCVPKPCARPDDDILKLYIGTENLRVYPDFSGMVTTGLERVGCKPGQAESEPRDSPMKAITVTCNRQQQKPGQAPWAYGISGCRIARCASPTDGTLDLYTGTEHLKVYPGFSQIPEEGLEKVECNSVQAEPENSSIEVSCSRKDGDESAAVPYEISGCRPKPCKPPEDGSLDLYTGTKNLRVYPEFSVNMPSTGLSEIKCADGAERTGFPTSIEVFCAPRLEVFWLVDTDTQYCGPQEVSNSEMRIYSTSGLHCGSERSKTTLYSFKGGELRIANDGDREMFLAWARDEDAPFFVDAEILRKRPNLRKDFLVKSEGHGVKSLSVEGDGRLFPMCKDKATGIVRFGQADSKCEDGTAIWPVLAKQSVASSDKENHFLRPDEAPYEISGCKKKFTDLSELVLESSRKESLSGNKNFDFSIF